MNRHLLEKCFVNAAEVGVDLVRNDGKVPNALSPGIDSTKLGPTQGDRMSL
jgi:hypothetical protein